MLSEWTAGAEASLREMELSCSQGQLANVEHCQKLKVGQPKISCYMLWAALPVLGRFRNGQGKNGNEKRNVEKR